MLRRLYCWLLRLHPPYFRRRFADEMLLIFDEKMIMGGNRAAAKLAADAVISLGRQWTLRPEFWEEPTRPTADGVPQFLSFERYKLRRGALLYGALLSTGILVLFSIAFSFGIHEALHTPHPKVSSRNSASSCVESHRTRFGGTAVSTDPHQRDSGVTLGPRNKEVRGVWARFMAMFATPPSSTQLASAAPHAPHDREAPGQVVTSMDSSTGRWGRENAAGEVKDLKVQLPHPSGKYGVARVAYDWVDGTRREPTPKYPEARREVIVYLWYPMERKAELSAGAADYLPHADLIARNLSRQELQQGWGRSWRRVFSAGVLTDTHKRSPIAEDERFPLVIFSPGLGLSSTSYTAQIQEVVSHGYVVASIEPDETAVAFPDGRVAHAITDAAFATRPSVDRSSSTPPEAWADYLDQMHTSGMPYVERRAADIRFVVNQLVALEKNGAHIFPFAGRIDFQNIGVWGHSIGGRAAARACQLDERIKACLNADGVGPNGPVFPYEGASLPRQPFMWMETSQLPPAVNSILTSYKVIRKDSDKERRFQLAAQEQELRACPGSSYHLMINDAETNHYSFTDWHLLEADKQEDYERASRALEPIETYTLAFFDKHLKHQEAALLDEPRNRASAQVTLKRYGNGQ